METSVHVLRFLETLQRAFWNALAKVRAEPPISQWEHGRLLSVDEFGASSGTVSLKVY
jgi:hypothetical protein